MLLEPWIKDQQKYEEKKNANIKLGEIYMYMINVAKFWAQFSS